MRQILLAEDHAGLRELTAMELKFLFEDLKLEIEILQAGTKQQALDTIAQSKNLELVVTDLRLPDEGDGAEIVQAASAKNCKIIVVSGSIRDLSDELKAQCFAVIRKLSGSLEAITREVQKVFLS